VDISSFCALVWMTTENLSNGQLALVSSFTVEKQPYPTYIQLQSET
jgi:hypothetical protein